MLMKYLSNLFAILYMFACFNVSMFSMCLYYLHPIYDIYVLLTSHRTPHTIETNQIM